MPPSPQRGWTQKFSRARRTTSCDAAGSQDDSGNTTAAPLEDLDFDRLSAKGFYSLIQVFGVFDSNPLVMGHAGNVPSTETEEQKKRNFAVDSKLLKQKIRRQQRGIINPRSIRMQYWDLVTSICLLFVVVVTPFEIAFVTETKVDALFIVNQCVNAVFIVDMVTNFFLPVPLPNGKTSKSHAFIARHYLSTWFALDLASVAPFDIVYLAGAFGPPEDPDVSPSALRAIRIVRLVRLVKLLRTLRGSRILQRWQDRIGLSNSVKAAIFWLVFTATVLHWIACLWKLAATALLLAPARTPEVEVLVADRMTQDLACTGCLSSIPKMNWDEQMTAVCELEYCSTPCEIEEAARLHKVSVSYQRAQESWLCRFTDAGLVPPQSDLFGNYLTCLASSVAMLSGGYMSSPNNNIEYGIILVVNLFGAFLWAIVQGVVCAMLSTGNPLETTYKNNLDAINFLMEDMKIPQALRTQMRAYMRSTKDTKKRMGYVDLIHDNFSPELQHQIRFKMAGHLLMKTPLFKPVEDFPNNTDFFEKLSACVTRGAYAPNETIQDPSSALYVVSSGMAAQAGIVMMKGDSFGNDCIISSPALRDQRQVRCLSYVEVAKCTRDNIFKTLEAPRFAKIRQHIVHLALVKATFRCVTMCSLYRGLVKACSEQKKDEEKNGEQEKDGQKKYGQQKLDNRVNALRKQGIRDDSVSDATSLNDMMKVIYPIITRHIKDATWSTLEKRDVQDGEEKKFTEVPSLKPGGTGFSYNAAYKELLVKEWCPPPKAGVDDATGRPVLIISPDAVSIQRIYSVGQGGGSSKDVEDDGGVSRLPSPQPPVAPQSPVQPGHAAHESVGPLEA